MLRKLLCTTLGGRPTKLLQYRFEFRHRRRRHDDTTTLFSSSRLFKPHKPSQRFIIVSRIFFKGHNSVCHCDHYKRTAWLAVVLGFLWQSSVVVIVTRLCWFVSVLSLILRTNHSFVNWLRLKSDLQQRQESRPRHLLLFSLAGWNSSQPSKSRHGLQVCTSRLIIWNWLEQRQ